MRESIPDSRLQSYELAWTERKRAKRMAWGALPAAVVLSFLFAPLGWYFDTSIFSQCIILICGAAGAYGAYSEYNFKCPNCGARFERGRWWPFPDRCGNCGIITGTVPTEDHKKPPDASD